MDTKIQIELTGLNDEPIELTLEVAFSVYGEYHRQTRDCPEEREEVDMHEVWVVVGDSKRRIDNKKSWEKLMEFRDNQERLHDKCWAAWDLWEKAFRADYELEVN